MCLLISNKKVRVAKDDIVCYKIVKKKGDRFVTPFRETEISYNIIAGTENFKAKVDKIRRDLYGVPKIPHVYLNYGRSRQKNYKVEDGFIHTYKNLPDAIRLMKYDYIAYAMEDDEELRLFKCIIPKGCKYYAGKTWGEDESYASKEIKFVEEIYT